MIQERRLGADLAAYDEAVVRSLARIEGMGKLVADLLDLTRIESGQKSRQLAPLDLAAAARTAIDNVAPAAQARNIALAPPRRRPGGTRPTPARST